LSQNRPTPISVRPPEDREVALAERRDVGSWRDPDWQRLWLTVEKVPWHSLALIPAGEGGPSDFTLALAVTLSRTGMSHVGGPIQVADGTQVPLNQLNAFLADVQSCTINGQRVIVALPPAVSNPTAPAIARSTDAAVLCVLLERMSSAQAQQTLKLVGASHFLGSIIIRADDMPRAK